MHDKTGNDADAFSWHAALLEALLSPSSPFTPHSPTTFQGPPDPRYLSRRSANRILILSHILPATSNPEGIMLTRSPPTSQPQLRIGFVALLFQGLSEGLCYKVGHRIRRQVHINKVFAHLVYAKIIAFPSTHFRQSKTPQTTTAAKSPIFILTHLHRLPEPTSHCHQSVPAMRF